MTAAYTDKIARAGVTATRTWSADPATDPFAYVVDQRCDGCGTQVTDDDRGPLYDSATDDGTAHKCSTGFEGPAQALRANDFGCVLREKEADGTSRTLWQRRRTVVTLRVRDGWTATVRTSAGRTHETTSLTELVERIAR